MREFRMPSLGADMEAGTLVEWMIKPGDRVERGQVVAVVETQKGAIDVEIWEAGTVERLLVAPGAKVPVGTVLAQLDGTQEAVATSAREADAVPARAAPTPTPVAAPAPRPSVSGGAPRRRVSPAARKRAEELKIDIESVEPAVPDGTISIGDVERAAQGRGATAPGAPAARSPQGWHAEMRKAIAAAMSRSKREIPHYYLARDIDVSEVTAWLTRLNAERSLEKRLLPAVIFMKAVALALRRVPDLNGVWRDGAFEPSVAVHLGMAIAMRGGGLVAPAVHDADKKSIDELMGGLRDLIERVRSGRLRSSELADPTITLTSLGDTGVDRVYGVIYPPQVAIVGLGTIRERPWVLGGLVQPRQILTATLAADHRVSDGQLGARFLLELERLLADPEKWQGGAS